MTASKKKRMSMLDSLATAGTPAAPGSMMSTNRALRSARDAVDAHHVWELDPDEIEDGRGPRQTTGSPASPWRSLRCSKWNAAETHAG